MQPYTEWAIAWNAIDLAFRLRGPRIMIKKLYRRLTLLFTVTTSLILTLVLGITWFYQFTHTNSQREASFQTYLTDLAGKLKMESTFSDHWLAKLESDNHLIVHIEENGRPLFFSGSWIPKTNRDTLVQLAKEKARKENIDTSVCPISYTQIQSSTFSLKGEKRDTYLGTVFMLTTEQGYRSLVLLADTTLQRKTLLFQTLLFLFLGLIGVLALFLTSCYVVGRALKPVAEYHNRQTDFVAAASHELRSPLAVIQTCASAILSMPEHASSMAESIQSECVRAGGLVKNLLLLASVDAKNLTEEQTEVEADSLLLKLFETYEPLCRRRGIHLRLVLPEDFLPPVLGNSQWIFQILCIFLDNAITHGCPPDPKSAKKPVITLRASVQGKEILLSVEDHGPGIPEKLKSKIFDRFYRGDSSRNQKEHFGLGLSIADALADLMHAPIKVLDTEGSGTTFCLSLPLAQNRR